MYSNTAVSVSKRRDEREISKTFSVKKLHRAGQISLITFTGQETQKVHKIKGECYHMISLSLSRSFNRSYGIGLGTFRLLSRGQILFNISSLAAVKSLWIQLTSRKPWSFYMFCWLVWLSVGNVMSKNCTHRYGQVVFVTKLPSRTRKKKPIRIPSAQYAPLYHC